MVDRRSNVIFWWHSKISREHKENHAHVGFWVGWFPDVSLRSRWVVDVDWSGAGKCNAIISSKAHQQKANISTGRCTSLQCLTYYHNIVAESPLAPLFQLIAERQAADPKLCSFYGELSSTLFWRSTSLCIQTPTGYPPKPVLLRGLSEEAGERGLLFSPLQLTLNRPIKI